MQSLAAALGSQARAFVVDTSDPEAVHRFLADLPPTGVLEASITEYQARLDRAAEDAWMRPRIVDFLERAELLLSRARQRDALRATRPEGCTCLGMGGLFPRYTGDGERIYAQCCTACPEGRAAQVRRDEIEREHQVRQREAHAARLFGEARIPTRFQGCTFATYPESPETAEALATIRRWVDGPGDGAPEWERLAWAQARPKSLFLYGPYGTGKTGLAVSVLRGELPMQGGGLFFTVPSLLDAIRATYAEHAIADERDVIEAVKTAPFLVLDDLGAERVTEWVREKLFTVINYRHDEDLPTVFTSNLDVPQLAEHIGERTAWRVVEMSLVVKLDGPNLRERKS